MTSSIVAFTGHRPERLKRNLSEIEQDLRLLLRTTKPDKAIVGMADGFDTIAGLICMELCIPYIAAIPYKKHYTYGMRKPMYATLIQHATGIHFCADGYSKAAYAIRDKWMVDNATHVIAGYDGTAKGGTYITVDYALKQGKPVFFIEVKENV